jgi:hypothetical protein
MRKSDGEMKKMGSLFDIYKTRLIAPQKSVIEAAVEVIEDVTGIKIKSDRCQYTVYTKTLATNAPALIRQELKQHEEVILTHLKARLGEKSAPTRII